jgi:ComEC/Rec2-related protein
MIPAIGYLLGILSVHALLVYHLLPLSICLRLNGILLSLTLICTVGFLCFWLLPRYTLLRFSNSCCLFGVFALFFTGAWCYYRQNNLSLLPNNNNLTLFYGYVERVTITKSQRFMRINTRIVAFRQEDETHLCNTKTFIYIPVDQYDQNLQIGSKIWTVSRIQVQDSTFHANSSMPPSIFLSHSNPLFFTAKHPSFPARLGKKLLAHLKANIRDPNSYALLAGLSLGNKEAFDPELKNAYSSAGAIHVLAVSGLHVGIIYAVLLTLCNLLIPGNNRWRNNIKQLIILSLITLFAALAGFTPSVTRALLMVLLSTFGKMIRRPVSTMQTLFATALIICVLNPSALFEIGFQLSFSAVLFILIVQPPLLRLLHPKTIIGKYVWSLLCVSTAAQSGTAALAYYYFGTFPYLFLLTNLFVIPLTCLLLYLLCAWFAFGVIPVVGPILLWMMEHTAWVMNQGVILIDKLM